MGTVVSLLILCFFFSGREIVTWTEMIKITSWTSGCTTICIEIEIQDPPSFLTGVQRGCREGMREREASQ